jgi:hypothetical protein
VASAYRRNASAIFLAVIQNSVAAAESVNPVENPVNEFHRDTIKYFARNIGVSRRVLSFRKPGQPQFVLITHCFTPLAKTSVFKARTTSSCFDTPVNGFSLLTCFRLRWLSNGGRAKLMSIARRK